jgi:hypothetical protein
MKTEIEKTKDLFQTKTSQLVKKVEQEFAKVYQTFSEKKNENINNIVEELKIKYDESLLDTKLNRKEIIEKNIDLKNNIEIYLGNKTRQLEDNFKQEIKIRYDKIENEFGNNSKILKN